MRIPFSGVHLEQLFHKVFRLRGDLRPRVSLKLDLPFQHHLEDLLLVVSPEGWQAGQQDVEDDTERPEVGLKGVVLAKHFRGDVVGGADKLIEALFGLEED